MIVAISRAKRFSPNSEDKDARILKSLCDLLKQSGFDIKVMDEDNFSLQPDADLYISMARSEATLKILNDSPVPVINKPESVLLNCQNRKRLFNIISVSGFYVPFASGYQSLDDVSAKDGYWVKKNYGYSECEQDVVYARNVEERDAAVAAMKARGIEDVYVCPHIKGDLVKFYGVCNTPFFRFYYPDDDGEMKFSNNGHNGVPKHTPFDAYEFWCESTAVANTLGLDFYGGDCIVKENGDRVYIDINDWPSYSRCYKEAAEYMAILAVYAMHHGDLEVLRNRIKSGYYEAVIFDYGGTLDSDGMHWGKRIWHAYQKCGVPVDEALFREAYVHAERTLATNPIILKDDDFTTTLRKKLFIEMDYISEHIENFNPYEWICDVLYTLIDDTKKSTDTTDEVMRYVFGNYVNNDKTILVSNFYGNINAVLRQFGLEGYFSHVIESAVVGVRKPDPEIWRMGLRALGVTDASKVLVIGDSYDKDIIPAHEIGCDTLWFMGEGWTPVIPDGKQADWVMTTWFDIYEP